MDCEHLQTILISARRAPERDETVSVCRDCGEIHVRARIDGVHVSVDFALYTNFLLLAVSQAYRRYLSDDEEPATRERVWKPFDFAEQRLYQVHREWDIGTRNFKQDYVVAASAPSAAAALIEKQFEEFYQLNNVTFHFATGAPLNILQPVEWTKNGLNVLNADIGEAFVPGEYICPKCDFRLSRRLVNMNTQEVGIDPSSELPTCQTDGQLMQQVSWRQAAADATKMAQRDAARVRALEAAWPDGFPMPVEDDNFIDLPDEGSVS